MEIRGQILLILYSSSVNHITIDAVARRVIIITTIGLDGHNPIIIKYSVRLRTSSTSLQQQR